MHSWSIFRVEKFVDDNFDKAKWRGSNSLSSLNSKRVVEFLDEILEILCCIVQTVFKLRFSVRPHKLKEIFHLVLTLFINVKTKETIF